MDKRTILWRIPSRDLWRDNKPPKRKRSIAKRQYCFSKNVFEWIFFTQDTYHSLLKERSRPCFYRQSQWIFRPRHLFRFLRIQSAAQVIRGIRGLQFRPVITDMLSPEKNFESVKCSLPPEVFWKVSTFLILNTGNIVDTIQIKAMG